MLSPTGSSRVLNDIPRLFDSSCFSVTLRLPANRFDRALLADPTLPPDPGILLGDPGREASGNGVGLAALALACLAAAFAASAPAPGAGAGAGF